MNLNLDNWTKKDYQEYQKLLKDLSDEKYKNFHSKLTTTKYTILGIKVPIQRKLAKEILKGNPISFLNHVENNTYEETNIEGFVIAGLNDEQIKTRIDNFILKIDNWAICDGFCSSLKINKHNEEYYFNKAKELLKSKEEFSVRVGLVILLNHFVKSPYIKTILEEIDNINREEYYINMAIAWLVAEMYIKDKSTLEFIKNNHLNPFTQNKTISKINDSYRVSKEEKDEVNLYKVIARNKKL